MPLERPYIGVAAIVIKKGKVLLGRRKKAHGDGTWQFPGGHLEFGESIYDCARREVLEETGIRIRNLCYGPFTNDIFREEKKHYVTLFILAEYESGIAKVMEPDKCHRWGWFLWDHLPKPHFLPIKNLLKQGFSISPAGQLLNG